MRPIPLPWLSLALLLLGSPAHSGSTHSEARINQPPLAPVITEPANSGQIVNPADVHMETGPFSDPDPGDQHAGSDWEIWRNTPWERVWVAAQVRGLEKLHAHFGDGVFENSHAGRSELFASTLYTLRVRHYDDSGDPLTEVSVWSTRTFLTASPSQAFPLLLEDIAEAPAPRWVDAASALPVILPPASIPPQLRLESPAGALLLAIQAHNGTSNTLVNPPALSGHEALRVLLHGGLNGLALPATDLTFVDAHCRTQTVLLPAMLVAPGAVNVYWVSTSGATYVGTLAQSTPDFSTLARGLSPPWDARQEGFEVEVFASGLQLPVNIAFVPAAGPDPDDPFLYVTELYGKIRVVARDGSVGTYASGLLNFNPTGAFPGSGEQGLTGIVVHPATGDVYAALLHASASNPSNHFPRIVRFTSLDGGKTAASQVTVLDMLNEPQGQSHQISNLTLTPDGKLLCHMGDGFVSATAQNLDSYRGKILRLNLDGSPATDNPFYNAGNGINARDYVFAYGVRNPFGGAWRAADGRQYMVENGPSVDRFAKVVPGQNYLWNGGDASMLNFALYNWNPACGPVNLAFVQTSVFGGSGFPASSLGHAFVSESGPTYASGIQASGKRITEWILDASGALVAGPIPFLEYTGTGKATACALAAGPDGLYMSELYFDQGSSAIQAGARILRIHYRAPQDCNANGVDDVCDLASGTSPDINANGIPDECDCAGTVYCTAKTNSLGCVPAIDASGSATSAGADDFVIRAADVLNQQAGVVVWSLAAATIPFGGGTLCLLPPVRRMGGLGSGGSATGNDCTGSYAQPVTDAYMANQGLTPGLTAHFQVWMRDPGFAPPDAIGLTDALRVLICP